MRDVKVDRRDPTDLHEQVAADIRRAIADGEAKPGERLPPAKDLAAVLGVNTNTVLRSLRTLRDEGLLEFRRGRGISIAGTPERGAVVQRARELVDFARHHGYQVDELVEIIEHVGYQLRVRCAYGLGSTGRISVHLASLRNYRLKPKRI